MTCVLMMEVGELLMCTVGSPQYPDTSAIAALKSASALTVESLMPVPGVEKSEGGQEGTKETWTLTLSMPMYSVASLSF